MFLLTALVIAAADVTRVAMPMSAGLPEREPAAVGMSAERLGTIDRVVQRGVEAGGYPGASVVVGRKGYSVFSRGIGTLDWTRKMRVSAQESIYDLASLTKVVATTTALMVLYDRGQVDLDAKVSTYLPTFSGGLKDQVTVRHLLTHRAGLSAGRELWRIADSPAEARAAVLSSPVNCTPGACYEYSDLGADLLGFIAEVVSGQSLDVFLQQAVFQKLGMNDTQFRVSELDMLRTAPTEIAPPRGYPLRGEVHDENAFALGGIAGHAGLFSTASDLSVFAQMLLDGGQYNGVRVIADSTVQLFTKRAAGHRALGWDTCDGGAGCGQFMSERAFGHTGFTGTSLWIDPDRQMFVVLLTNRVHAARARRPSKVIADVRNDLADAAVLAVMDDPEGVRAMPASFRADLAQDWNRPLRSRRASSAAARRRAAAAKRAATRKAVVKKKSSGSVKTSPTRKASATKATAKKATVKKATVKKATVKKATAKKATVKKSPPKKSGTSKTTKTKARS
ncbi:serine hydrolase domain-containing protein [Gemmatimonas phototrophica]|uniref:serine hydrolase domain-containing protein n=1 Tax=Gemmatimonas phototrophica TaxID=1379270 RepID=UPI0006A6C4D7|nr:serine hydrolase domain-containing protein [Gemmatimonas phototrophica]